MCLRVSWGGLVRWGLRTTGTEAALKRESGKAGKHPFRPCCESRACLVCELGAMTQAIEAKDEAAMRRRHERYNAPKMLEPAD